jgi:hypothetical protein
MRHTDPARGGQWYPTSLSMVPWWITLAQLLQDGSFFFFNCVVTFVWRGLLIFSLMVVFLEKKTFTALKDHKNIE